MWVVGKKFVVCLMSAFFCSHLFQNQLEGSIPVDIGKLTGLQDLYVHMAGDAGVKLIVRAGNSKRTV